MRNISDVIEAYLKEVIQSSNSDVVELKRSEIADQFECVPSQINYVINTRFTLEKGYLVESKRGGGGYIRIIRLRPKSKHELLNEMHLICNKPITQQVSFDLLDRLRQEDLISDRELHLMTKLMHRDLLTLPVPDRDIIRSRMFQELITTIKMHDR
ncbi:CtsR family transcriptional regulator [Halalkalibacillus halophilus]|uniref:CtsR family transcriptional regulator n=1 Tax=Halalkalibacillus halophilus TaxID=392827 RepID=UPI0004021E79|nr:CtsR family transcriptional regulator [Halalkalibacillus halophilus]